MNQEDSPTDDANHEGLKQPVPGASISRLTAAFASMLGTTSKPSADDASESVSDNRRTVDPGVTSSGIIEAILFVGLPDSSSAATGSVADGAALPAETIAGAMRDVSVEEVAREIDILNEQYEQDGSPYTIEHSDAGYRMVLRVEFHSLREGFHGRARSAKLTPATLEVLSVIAYQQPVSGAVIDSLRGERSANALLQLVRRGLIERQTESPPAPTQSMKAQSVGDTAESEEPKPEDRGPWYRTTDRFLKLMELEAVGQLPQVGEHND